MSLNEMVKQAQEKGLLSICPFTLRGKSESTFGLLSIMVKTEPIEDDPEEWRNILWIRRN